MNQKWFWHKKVKTSIHVPCLNDADDGSRKEKQES